LQQSGAFTDRSASFMTARMRVLFDARQSHFMGIPVNKAFVVLLDQHGPFGLWQFTNSFSEPSGFVHVTFLSSLTIRVGACIDRIGQA